MMDTFDQLGLGQALLDTVKSQGYSEPSPIQAKAIPVVLKGRDILATAETGTGKTASFVLPLLQRLSEKEDTEGKKAKIKVLVLVPTRELAIQVTKSIQTYGSNLPFKSLAVFGGVRIQNQIREIKKGLDLVVATPGRLIDLHRQRAIKLSKVETLVLDEADRMLDMGFLPDIEKILGKLPKERQTLLFSATLMKGVRELAYEILNDAETIDIAHNQAVGTVVQKFFQVNHKQRERALIHLIQSNKLEQVLIFTRTKYGADDLVFALKKAKLKAEGIHGDKTQHQRARSLSAFKNGKFDILVATDIASRGLDIEKLPVVVNYDFPHVLEDYIHRIGRTGRAGEEGLAISFISAREKRKLKDLEKLLKEKCDVEFIPGFETEQQGRGNRNNRKAKPSRYERESSRNSKGKDTRFREEKLEKNKDKPYSKNKFKKDNNEDNSRSKKQKKPPFKRNDVEPEREEKSFSKRKYSDRRKAQDKPKRSYSESDDKGYKKKNVENKRGSFAKSKSKGRSSELKHDGNEKGYRENRGPKKDSRRTTRKDRPRSRN